MRVSKGAKEGVKGGKGGGQRGQRRGSKGPKEGVKGAKGGGQRGDSCPPLKEARVTPARFIRRHGLKVHHWLLLLLLLLWPAAGVHGVKVLHHAAHGIPHAHAHLRPVVRELRGRRRRRHGHARRHGARNWLRDAHLALALALCGATFRVARPHVYRALHQDLRLLAQLRLNGEQDHDEHHEDVDDVEALVLDAAVRGEVNDDAVDEVNAEQHAERLRENLGQNGQTALLVVGVGHVVPNDVNHDNGGYKPDGHVLHHVQDFALRVLVQLEHLLKEAAARRSGIPGSHFNGVHNYFLFYLQ